MLIEFNTDKNIEGGQKLADYFTKTLQEDLDRYDDMITRLVVHLGDENASKKGENDKRCLLEARIKNAQPVAVTEFADTIQKAVKGATEKLTSVLEKAADKKHM
jgi:ribosome-associated translation inhibitor RaiA